MFTVKSTVFTVHNKGTGNEFTSESSPRESGPFETRASAERFAAGLATQPNIASVQIVDDEEDE